MTGLMSLAGASAYRAARGALEQASEALAAEAVLAALDLPDPPVRLALGEDAVSASGPRSPRCRMTSTGLLR